MEDLKSGISQEDALAGFNNGKLVIVRTVDGFIICTQKLSDGIVRSAILGSAEELTPDQFRDRLNQREGGMMGLVKEALVSIGISSDVEPNSGVLRNLMYGVSARDVLSVFDLPEN